MDIKQLRWRPLVCAAAGLAGLLVAACADTESERVSATPTWTEMTASGGALSSCQGCHSDPASSAPFGLSFSPDQYTAVLAATSTDCPAATKIVNPGDHFTSVLYLVAVGDVTCTVSPLPMPGGTAAAPQIAAWIDAKAPQ